MNVRLLLFNDWKLMNGADYYVKALTHSLPKLTISIYVTY